MAEETEIERKEAEVEDDGTDYLQVIEDLKKNTVSKQDYQRLKEENKRLLNAYANGQRLPEDYQKQAQKANIDELRKELFEKERDNLGYVEKALELREALIAKGENDPFLPYGDKIMPTDYDIEAANRVAQVLQECVDYADGDSSVFTNELQRRMIDSSPMAGKKRR